MSVDKLEPKHGPPPPHDDEERVVHINVLAATMRQCMKDERDPRRISIAGEEGRVLIGPARFARWLPIPDKGRAYNLGAIFRIVQAVHPHIWQAAVDRIGGFRWRAFEMTCLARRVGDARKVAVT